MTLLFLPLGEVGRYVFPSIGNAPVLINDVLVGITISLWACIKFYRKEKIVSILLLPVSLFLGACILSLLLNSYHYSFSQVITAALYIVRWAMYAGLFFVIGDMDTRYQNRILYALLISGQIIVGIGYIQFFLYPSLGNLYYLGWDEHLYRMFSVFLDPNFAGVFFSLVSFLTLFLLLKHISKKAYGWAIFFALLWVMDIGAVYLTYSRTALLALIVSLIVFLWVSGKKKFILFTLLIIFMSIFLLPKTFQTEGTNLLRIASTEARMVTAQQAVAIFLENPILGVGFNAYRFAQYRYGYLGGPYWSTSHGGSSTDNSYLFVLATTGVIGGIAFGFLLYRIFMLCKENGKQTLLGMITLASLAGVGVSSLFNNSLFYVFILEWMWVLIGLVAVATKKKEK